MDAEHGEAQSILHGFAVDLLADRLYSKSTAFCHQRICLQHLDMSRCWRQIRCVASKSPANPFDMVQNGQIYSKSTAFIIIDESAAF